MPAECGAIQRSDPENGQPVLSSHRKRVSRGEHAPELLISPSDAIKRGPQDTSGVFR